MEGCRRKIGKPQVHVELHVLFAFADEMLSACYVELDNVAMQCCTAPARPPDRRVDNVGRMCDVPASLLAEMRAAVERPKPSSATKIFSQVYSRAKCES